MSSSSIAPALSISLPLQNSVLAVLHNADKIQVQSRSIDAAVSKTGHCSVNLSEGNFEKIGYELSHHCRSANIQTDCNNGFSPLKSNQARTS